ncbi:hypothetical protein [Teredinibacter turnerae]|uniref:hypothetical protein n=1 Tax=Teredinibacter turnerae TaxID=2426 RepID=UPI0030D4623C
MSDKILFVLLTGGAVVAGFTFGLAVGRATRDAAPSSVSTSMQGGVVTIQVDAGAALKQGLSSWK